MIANIILAILALSLIPAGRKAWQQAAEADRREALRGRGRPRR